MLTSHIEFVSRTGNYLTLSVDLSLVPSYRKSAKQTAKFITIRAETFCSELQVVLRSDIRISSIIDDFRSSAYVTPRLSDVLFGLGRRFRH